MHRLNIVLFTFFAALLACNQYSPRKAKSATATISANSINPVKPYTVDTSIISIFSVSWMIKDATPVILTNAELQKVEKLLTLCIQFHNAKQDIKTSSEYINLKGYRRQYVPYVNKKGERKVYVNCFCTDSISGNEWKKTFVFVFDGGACFFQVTINLSTLEYEGFSINGYA